MNHNGKNVYLVRCKKHGAMYFYCLDCGSDLSTAPRERRDIGVNSLATPEPIDAS